MNVAQEVLSLMARAARADKASELIYDRAYDHARYEGVMGWDILRPTPDAGPRLLALAAMWERCRSCWHRDTKRACAIAGGRKWIMAHNWSVRSLK